MPERTLSVYNQDRINDYVNILVTGGAGFVGRYLVESLLGSHLVTIFDDFSNSARESVSELVRAGVNVIEGDITQYKEIRDAAINQDVVVHLAAKISVTESIKNPAETFEVNVNGTRNVLAACKENNIKKLIVSSSAAVYGEGVLGVGVAEDEPLQPISPYGQSKAEMELEIERFVSDTDLKCVILRFFNIYGIGQADEYSGVITKFLKRIREGQDLEIFGDGMQKRDFVSIHDVINSINMALSHEKSGTYNIASGDAITIIQLAEKMISLSGKDLKMTHSDAKGNEINSSQASISLAGRDLQFVPKTTLDEGIAALIQARYE